MEEEVIVNNIKNPLLFAKHFPGSPQDLIKINFYRLIQEAVLHVLRLRI